MVSAWWDMGHILCVEIARRTLAVSGASGTATVNAMNQILAIDQDYYPYHSTLPTVGVWMDKLKATGMHQYDDWHFVNTPYIDNVSAPTNYPGLAFQALSDNWSTLKSATAWSWAKAFALRCVLHIAGDLHQPLHCISKFDKRTPSGDQGGNRFSLYYNASGVIIKDLHSLFDSVGGSWTDYMPEPITSEYNQLLSANADAIMNEHPPTSFPDGWITDTKWQHWANESYYLAIEQAYTVLSLGQTIDQSYIDVIRPMLRKRIALAGYRIANLMLSANLTILGPHPASLSSSSSDSQIATIALGASLGFAVVVLIPIAFWCGKRSSVASMTSSTDYHDTT